jgi:hypothetical protein
MKQKTKVAVGIFGVFFAIILVISLFLSHGFPSPVNENIPDFCFGVDVAYGNVDEIKKIIDEVSSYTNLFLIGSTAISHNTTKLYEICQYLSEKDLYFITYDELPFYLNSVNDVQKKWNDKFIGLEYEDEIGGGQLDMGEYRPVTAAKNYLDATNQFVGTIRGYLGLHLPVSAAPSDFRLFTVDYALYWFDYKAGYDVVLAEFGWNYSRQLNVALCRGAATIQNKEWGIMITWTYDEPPYIESGAELYRDLVLAYENGAKYIMVFDSNKEYTQGILRQEHFEALKQFWEYTQEYPRKNDQTTNRVAYVLPKGFAYGFRGPNDKIWGLWEANAVSLEISETLGNLLDQYKDKLDVIYDDGLALDSTYGKYFFWNGTTYSP